MIQIEREIKESIILAEKSVIQGQRPDRETDKHNKEHTITKNTLKKLHGNKCKWSIWTPLKTESMDQVRQ